MGDSLITNFIISPRKRFFRGLGISIGVFAMVYGFWNHLSSGESGTLWIIDNSLSMIVTDIGTESGILMSRLDLAKQIIKRESANMDGQQALMSAALGGKLELPMTSDHSVLRDVIQGINPVLRGGGTSLSTPLDIAKSIYGDMPNFRIIWLTDGEFSDTGYTLSGYTHTPSITFVGLGSPSGGPIMLGYSSDGLPRYKDSQGQRVQSIRDDKKLSTVSKSLGANLILRDRSIVGENLLGTSTDIARTTRYSLWLLLGSVLVIVSLMYSRYQYNPQQTPGK